MRLLPLLLLLGAAMAQQQGAGAGEPRYRPPSAPLPSHQLPHGRGLCDLRAICQCDLPRGWVNCTCPPLYQDEVVLQSKGDYHLPANLRNLRISGCPKLRVPMAAFSDLPKLRSIDIHNVPSLIVDMYGFSWNDTERLLIDIIPQNIPPGININITNSRANELPSFAFMGRVDVIALDNVWVGTVRAFAFASLRHVKRLEISNCDISHMEPQAFKKFSVENVLFKGGRVRGPFPSRAFTDLEVREDFTVDGVTFDTVLSSAFRIHGPRHFRLLNSYANIVRGEAFSVVVHGPVFIQNNRLLSVDTGAFYGISVDRFTVKMGGAQKVVFENNTLLQFQDGAIMFNTTGMEIQLDRVILDIPCDCESLDEWSRELLNPRAYPPPARFPIVAADTLFCRRDQRRPIYTTSKDHKENSCGFLSLNINLLLIISISFSIVLLSIIVFLIVCCRRRQARKRKRWIGSTTNNINSMPWSGRQGSPKSRTPTMIRDISDDKEVLRRKPRTQFKRQEPLPEEARPFTLVVPDGRTYRETELHVIVERAEPLREDFAKDLNHHPLSVVRSGLTAQ